MSHTISISHSPEKEAIVDAVYRSIIGLDTNDRVLWESAFDKPDAVFVFGDDTMNGMDAINTGIFDRVGPLDTQHSISNVRVDHKAGTNNAYLTAYAIAQHYKAGEGMTGDAKRLLAGASYFIDLVKDSSDGLWKIKKWAMKLIWIEGDMSIVRPS